MQSLCKYRYFSYDTDDLYVIFPYQKLTVFALHHRKGRNFQRATSAGDRHFIVEFAKDAEHLSSMGTNTVSDRRDVTM